MVAESQTVVEEQPEHTVVVQVSAKIDDQTHKKNRIQVSNAKKPLFFYLNLAKRYMKQHNEVELSALGMAIPTAVTIAEILKANGIAVEKTVLISTVGTKDETTGRLVLKAKLEIVLEKNEKAANNQKTSLRTTKVGNKKASSAITEVQKTNKTVITESKTNNQENATVALADLVQIEDPPALADLVRIEEVLHQAEATNQ